VILNETDVIIAVTDTNLRLVGVTATGNSDNLGGAIATTATNTTAGAETLTITGSTIDGNTARPPVPGSLTFATSTNESEWSAFQSRACRFFGLRVLRRGHQLT
jgi:hypothetical protein